MKTIRLGIIGAGGIVAKMHLPSLQNESSRCQVSLVAGRKESRLRVFRDRFGIPRSTTRYEDVIEDPEIDAVLIATPHPLHVPWGLRAIQAGKHVLIEKPLSGDLDSAGRLVEAAEKTDRTVMCLPHFPPVIHTIRKMIRDGVLGEVSSARCRVSHGGPEVYYREISSLFGEPEPEDLWFFDASKAGVGALFDMGVYAVSHLIAVAGSATEVTALAGTVGKPTDLEDTAAILLQMENRAVAVAETGWCDPARTWALSVTGTAANLETSDRGENRLLKRPTALDRDNAPVESAVFDLSGDPGSIHGHFLDCVAEGRQPPLANARTARHVTEILLASMESVKTGRRVAVSSRLA